MAGHNGELRAGNIFLDSRTEDIFPPGRL